MLTTDDVKRRARELGFDLCGVAPAAALPELARLDDWLARGYAGEMVYLHKQAAVRRDIRHFLPAARAVIVTGTLYNTGDADDSAAFVDDDDAPLPRSRQASRPPDSVRVARYARGADYHLVLAERLERLVEWMRAEHGSAIDARIFVDKHHVQERTYAAYAGLGWIGKNGCLINPDIGSWLLLAGVAVDLDLTPDAPSPDQCGSCTICLDACPTAAIVEPTVVDATKCIAYLTIEVQGEVPEPQRAGIGTHLFGCDICQEVCPWNLAAPITTDPAWQPRVSGEAGAAELWQRSDQELHEYVKGSAMTHAPLARLRRNLATIIGNAGDARLGAVLDAPGRGVRNAAHSAGAPIVADAVAWARRRLDADD
ncbi:MAG: tRNA epoxyqueuosine(34) reductase QueG [Acidobacteria bacterium]|nr:tRNA epoxyqueuosine(34) reductase QueG [Acidobacteriota bacterium]